MRQIAKSENVLRESTRNAEFLVSSAHENLDWTRSRQARLYLLPEIGVVVETKLGVHAQDVSSLDFGERVDLDLGRVLLLEELVQFDKDVGRFLLRVGLELELLSDLERLVPRESRFKVDRGRDDRRRVVARNVLDAEGARASGYPFERERTTRVRRLTSFHPVGKRRGQVRRVHGR